MISVKRGSIVGSRFFIQLLTACCLSTALLAEADVFSELSIEAHGNIAPIGQIRDDLRGAALSDGEFISYRHRLTAGFSKDAAHFFVFHRETSLMEFNQATAQVAYSLENDEALPSGVYPISLKANRISGSGFGYGYRWEYSPTLTIQPRLSFIQANQVTHGSLTGELRSDGTDTTGDLALRYFYSRDSILDRTPEDVVGRGLTLDLSAQWRMTPNWTLNLLIEDMLSYIAWNQVTTTEADATTTVTELSNDQWQTFPALAGFEGNRDQTQHITRLTELNFQRHLSAATDLMLTPRWIGRHFMPEIGYRIHSNHSSYRIDLIGEQAAPRFTWVSGDLSLSLAADALEFDAAHSVQLRFSVRPSSIL